MREETINTTASREQIEGLRHMTVGQLKEKYHEVFGEDSRSNHKQFLFRRVAWRIQANAKGGLSATKKGTANSPCVSRTPAIHCTGRPRTHSQRGNTPMADEKPDPIDVAHQVIVLAFDLVDTEIPQLPGQVAQALQSPPVQAAIKKTLLDFANSHAGSSGAALSATDGQKLLEAMGTGVSDAASANLLEQIKKTPEYKKLLASIEAFKIAATSTSLGVWVDKNKNILYVVGAALAVGTASVLYITKTGGTLVNTAISPIKGTDFEVLQIGTLKIKAGLWDFQPDARIFGARVASSLEWQKVTIDLKLGVLAQGAQVQKVEGAAVVKSGPFSVTVTADGKPQVQQVNLGLKLDYNGMLQNGKFNIGVGAMYQDKALSGTLGASYQTKSATIGVQGNVGPQKGGGVQYGGLLTLTIPL